MELLEAYRSLWSNRSLPATENNAETVLSDAKQQYELVRLYVQQLENLPSR